MWKILIALFFMCVPKSFAIAGWSEKYKVNCQTCHAPTFARLNYDGEKFLWNGYQSPDDSAPDGDKAGKKAYGDNLALDKAVRNWMMARLNINPIQVTTKVISATHS